MHPPMQVVEHMIPSRHSLFPCVHTTEDPAAQRSITIVSAFRLFARAFALTSLFAEVGAKNVGAGEVGGSSFLEEEVRYRRYI